MNETYIFSFFNMDQRQNFEYYQEFIDFHYEVRQELIDTQKYDNKKYEKEENIEMDFYFVSGPPKINANVENTYQYFEKEIQEGSIKIINHSVDPNNGNMNFLVQYPYGSQKNDEWLLYQQVKAQYPTELQLYLDMSDQAERHPNSWLDYRGYYAFCYLENDPILAVDINEERIIGLCNMRKQLPINKLESFCLVNTRKV